MSGGPRSLTRQTGADVPAAIVVDSNVFVAAGFNRGSAAARVLEEVRAGRVRMVWSEETRRETRYILGKIPPLAWDEVAELFRPEDRHADCSSAGAFDYIPDPDDRKFAALATAAGVQLLTNDAHLLESRQRAQIEILTPAEFWVQRHTVRSAGRQAQRRPGAPLQ